MIDKKRPLVSIISPCYNGENYVGRMLDSILEQTYDNIELICVDDGSEDGTGTVIEKYIPMFEKAEKTLLLFKQENLGQAAAVNKGLKKISGEYLAWIDCDDFLTADSIEKRVDFLESHLSCDLITTGYYVVNEQDVTKIVSDNTMEHGFLSYQPNQFCLTLVGRSNIDSHCQMIRVSAMKRINPKMEISTVRAGQNYQLLLPMQYFYKRGFIAEPLAYYVIRSDSHYHSPRTDLDQIKRMDELIQMLEETFRMMGLPEWESARYIKMSYFYKEKIKRINCLTEQRGEKENG